MRPKRLLALLLVLGLAAGGCGSDDDGDGVAATTSSTEETAAPPVFEIRSSEVGETFTFKLPTDVQGGVVTLKLVNDGKATHDFQLTKQVPGHTLDELLAQVVSEEAPLNEWVVAAGGVGTTDPGKTTEATLDLEPGAYWYFCTESSDSEEEGGEPRAHANHGMAGELTLTGDSGAAMPDASASIEAVDYGFTTTGLKVGITS
jgi:hypothetical protein